MLLALALVLQSCRTSAPPSAESQAPQRLGAETNAEIVGRYKCSDVFELDRDGLHYKVLVFGASSKDPGLIAYRPDAAGYVQAGSLFLSGYSAPQLITENGKTFIRTVQTGGRRRFPCAS